LVPEKQCPMAFKDILLTRWREFILGGATKSLLSKPPLPILFSH